MECLVTGGPYRTVSCHESSRLVFTSIWPQRRSKCNPFQSQRLLADCPTRDMHLWRGLEQSVGFGVLSHRGVDTVSLVLRLTPAERMCYPCPTPVPPVSSVPGWSTSAGTVNGIWMDGFMHRAGRDLLLGLR